MAAREGPRRQVPFGGHQIAEYAVAAALVAVGIHLNGRPAAVLVVGGVVLVALALVSKGPLAAARVVPRRLHLSLDLVVALAFALSPLLYLHDLQVIPVILTEAVALLLVRMSLTTEIVPQPRPDKGSSGSSAARLGALFAARPSRTASQSHEMAKSADSARTELEVPKLVAPNAASAVGTADVGALSATGDTKASPGTAGGQSSPSDTAGAVAATAGRLVGTAVAKARDSDVPTVAARSLGRATGHARRIGRAARAAKTAPAAAPPASAAPETSTPAD